MPKMWQAFNRKFRAQQIEEKIFLLPLHKKVVNKFMPSTKCMRGLTVLNEIVAKKEVMDLHQQIFKSLFGKTNEERLCEIHQLEAEIDKNKARIDKAMQMMLDGEIESFEYKAIKSKFDMANPTLLREGASLELDKVDYSSKINGCFNLLKHLDKFYHEAEVSLKQKIVGSNFPGKLIYENGQIQTPKMNEVLSLIMLENNTLGHKKGTKKKFFSLCPRR